MRIINPADLEYFEHLRSIIESKCRQIVGLINPYSCVLDFKLCDYKLSIIITIWKSSDGISGEKSEFIVPINIFCGGEEAIKKFVEKQNIETNKAKEPADD